MFVQLDKREQFLREFALNSGVLQPETANFVKTWIDQGLKQWCISRDGSVFRV